MKLLNTTLKNSIQVIVRLIISILNIKIIAVLVGPTGMALVSNLLNALQVGVSISNLGFKEGIVKYVSQHKNEQDKQAEFISTSIIAVLFTSILIGLLTFLFSKSISEYVLKSVEYYPLFRLCGIYLSATALLNLLLSFLNGLEYQKQFVILNITLSISAFLVAIGAVVTWGLDGLLWAQIFTTIIAFITGIIIYKKVINIPIKRFSPQIIKQLSKYSIMTLFAAIAGPAIIMTIRNIIIKETSLDIAGLWDGINKISNSYILVITSSFGYYFIPTFSQLNTREEISKEVKKAYKLLLPLLLIGGTSIFFAKDQIIKILFTQEFEGMRPLFIWQTIGDFFKVLAWVIGMLLISKARIKTFITTEIISLGLQVVLVKLITSHLSSDYINLYYAIENFIYFLMMISIFHFYYRKEKPCKAPNP
jgi:O-antigen/teichoic acid export membrane protein